MPFFMSVANVINLILDHWLISAFALAVFASVCLGIFKGAKHGIRAIFVTVVIAALTVCGFLIYYFVEKDLEGLIKFGIAWLPTIIFIIAVLSSTLVGVRRGLRKSLILLLHAVIVAGVCLGAYFFCITSPVVDKFMLDLSNLFLGQSGLQSQLGVSSECSTMREVLLEYFNNFFAEQDEIGILLNANSAYVLTLINMIYRIAFAVILFIVYEILLFLMYVIYLIFYPERRYRKKRNNRFALNETDASYKKRPVGGGCVGMVRGLVTGIISLSFLGSIFFVATGGVNASRLPENVNFGNNEIVSIYRSVESYGDQGIFKILNAIRDPEDTPYYLYAADIVFSGGLDDELHGVSGDIKFRKELGAYTGFAKDTLALLMKYGEDELTPIMQGEGGDDAMDKILGVCLKPEFRVEFDNLIDNFDQQTYIINFALSLADAVIANIDEMSFMSNVSADNKELLQLMFKHGYICETIPDERELKNIAIEQLEEVPPHLTINHLFTKKDAQVVLDIVLSILAGEIDVDKPLTVAKTLIPYVEELSILSSERSEEMDPVLCRMYCYFDNKYLTDEGEDGITYASVKGEAVQWTNEIRALLHVSDAIFTMYDHVAVGGDLLTNVLSVFDEENENYAENVKAYEELTEVVSDSALIGKVLNSKKISALLDEQLQKLGEKLGDDIYFPEKISYENKYDGDGNLVRNGELYYLLRGFRLLADKSNKEIIDALLDENMEFADIAKKLSETITSDDPNAHGNTLSEYLTESVLLRSVLSSVILQKAGDVLVVPEASLEINGSTNESVNLINCSELREIFDAFPQLVDLIIPLAEEGLNSKTVNDLLKDETFVKLLNKGNKIAEATVGKALIKQFAGNETVIIPVLYYDAESWISESAENAGELRRLLKSVEILGLDVEKLMSGDELLDDSIFTTLENLDSDKVEEMFSSEVFHYSISKVLDGGQFGFGDFDIVIPASACTELKDDTLSRIIRKSELVTVFMDLKEFGISSDTSTENILRKLVEQKQIVEKSAIISASVVNFIVDEENDISSILDIPENYKEAGKRENLQVYNNANPWRKELPEMIGALDEVFNISHPVDGVEFEFTDTAVSQTTNELILTLNDGSRSQPDTYKTRLDVCYSSDIISHIITREIDGYLTDAVIDQSVKGEIKKGAYNYPQEEISNLVYAFTELGMEKISDFEDVDFKDKLNILRDESKLDVVYSSNLIIGALTKSVKDTFNEQEELVYTDRAERSDISVLRKQEIFAIVDILGDAELENLDVSDIPISSVRKHLVPDANNNPNSYLILANFSDTLVNNRSLFVTSNVFDTESKLIDINEALRFIDAVEALCDGETSIDKWNVKDDLVLPEEQNRNVILSSVIMRATFSNEIMAVNSYSVFSADSVETGYDRIIKNEAKEKVAIINSDQLETLFEIIALSGGDGGQLKVPEFESISSVSASLDRIDILYDFDITRHSMSNIMLNDATVGSMIRNEYPQYIVEENCFVFYGSSSGWSAATSAILTREGIVDIASKF